jgi:hypothetical protein
MCVGCEKDIEGDSPFSRLWTLLSSCSWAGARQTLLVYTFMIAISSTVVTANTYLQSAAVDSFASSVDLTPVKGLLRAVPCALGMCVVSLFNQVIRNRALITKVD